MKSFSSIFSFFLLLFAANAFAQLENSFEQQPAAPTTTIEFETTEFDYGIIGQGDKVQYIYRFTNTGDLPLVITNAKGSCGCTVPSWPKAPVLPGEVGELKVEFNSKGKKGMQSKRVTITANTDPAQTFLTIKGQIVVPEEITEEQQNKPLEDLAIAHEKHSDSSPDCIALYPNPTSETLKLDIKEHEGKSANINIYNDLGQVVTTKSVDGISRSPISFDVSRYQPGIYTVTVLVKSEKPFSRCFVVANK